MLLNQKASNIFCLAFLLLSLFPLMVIAIPFSNILDSTWGYFPLTSAGTAKLSWRRGALSSEHRSTEESNSSRKLRLVINDCTVDSSLQMVEEMSKDLPEVFVSSVEQLAMTVGDTSGFTDLKYVLQEAVESSKKKKDTKGYSTVYDFYHELFQFAGKYGISGTLIEEDFYDPSSPDAAARTRKLSVSMDMADSELSSALTVGRSGVRTCPLASAWPLQWSISSKDFEGGQPVSINVMAVPAIRLDDGSYKLPTTLRKVPLRTLAKVNKKFLDQNGWRVKERKKRNDIKSGSRVKGFKHVTEYIFEVPSKKTVRCTTKYFFERCGLFSLTPREHLCHEWQNLCGINAVVELDEVSPQGHTHFLYLMAKLHGGNLNISHPPDKEKYEDYMRAHDRARGSAMQLARRTLYDMISMMQNSESIYVPELRPAQDSLTATVIVLVWFSEWIFGAFYSFGWFWHGFQRYEEKLLTTMRYKKKWRKLLHCFYAMVPAFVGYIPLLLGLAHSVARRNAIVGLMGLSWSKTSYGAFEDKSSSFDGKRGRVLIMVIQYVERSHFGNMFSYYLPATSVITGLMVNSGATILIKGFLLWARRPREDLEFEGGEVQKTVEDEDIEPERVARREPSAGNS